MSLNETFENLKRYIEHEIRAYESYSARLNEPSGLALISLRDRCYGAMIFTSYLASSSKEDQHWWDENVGKWWDNEMRPHLYKL
jgi:hypothetical protein